MSDALLDLTAKIVSAHVERNPVEADQLPEVIKSVFEALAKAAKPEVQSSLKEPAVPVKKSVFHDHIICLECGGTFRILKNHLAKDHKLSPEQYRERFGLPYSYPFIAPDYAAMRSKIAKQIGLGRKAGSGAAPKKPGKQRG